MGLQEIPFNLNESIKVKLTDYGIGIMKARREELNVHIKARGGVGLEPYEAKKDDDGYTTFQLWNLMGVFGQYIGLCKEQPFHLDIKVITRDKDNGEGFKRG